MPYEKIKRSEQGVSVVLASGATHRGGREGISAAIEGKVGLRARDEASEDVIAMENLTERTSRSASRTYNHAWDSSVPRGGEDELRGGACGEILRGYELDGELRVGVVLVGYEEHQGGRRRGVLAHESHGAGDRADHKTSAKAALTCPTHPRLRAHSRHGRATIAGTRGHRAPPAELAGFGTDHYLAPQNSIDLHSASAGP